MPEQAILHALRSGSEISDFEFDQIYPESTRRLSHAHWTPLTVARRAAHLLAGQSSAKILDVGSGAGKFCLIGAAVTRATFVGVEQRLTQVEAARDAAFRTGLTRARFVHRNMTDIDWSRFDGFYFYNPFHEHLMLGPDPLQEPIGRAPELYDRYVAATRAKLSGARAGTRVVTYHGYGGLPPIGYRLIVREPAGTDCLELWQKLHPVNHGTAA